MTRTLPLLLVALLAAALARGQPAAEAPLAERRAALQESLASMQGEEERITERIAALTQPVSERQVELAELEAELARGGLAADLEEVALATLKAQWQVQRDAIAADLAAARERQRAAQAAAAAAPGDEEAAATRAKADSEVATLQARLRGMDDLLKSDTSARELVALQSQVNRRRAELAELRARLLAERHTRERREAARSELADQARLAARRLAELERDQARILAERTRLEEELKALEASGADPAAEQRQRARIDLAMLEGYRVSEEIALTRGRYTEERARTELDERRTALSPADAPRRILQRTLDEETDTLAAIDRRLQGLNRRRALYQARAQALDREARLLTALQQEGTGDGGVSVKQRRTALDQTLAALDEHIALVEGTRAEESEYLATLEQALTSRHDVRLTFRTPRRWEHTTPAAAAAALAAFPATVVQAISDYRWAAARPLAALLAVLGGMLLAVAVERLRLRSRRARAQLRERTIGYRGLRIVTAVIGLVLGVAPATFLAAGVYLALRRLALPPPITLPLTFLTFALWAAAAMRIAVRYLRWLLRGGRIFEVTTGRRRGWRWLVRLCDLLWLFLATRAALVGLDADPAFVALLDDGAAATALVLLPVIWLRRPPVFRVLRVPGLVFQLALVGGTALLVLFLAGYRNLAAGFGGWAALVAVLVAAWGAATLLVADLWQATLGEHGRLRRAAALREQEAAKLTHTLTRITSAAVALGLFLWLDPTRAALESPLWQVVIRALRYPLVTLGEVAVSPLSLIQGLVVFGAFLLISRFLRRLLRDRVYPRTRLDAGVRNAISNFVNYGLLTLGVLVALQTIGIRLTTLTVFAGALGVGLGFGLQNIANNFVSGLILLVERPVKTGDYVDLTTTRGVVERIGARSTLIRTRDNIAIVVPNSEFISQTVTNWSLKDPKTRIHVEVGVAYGTDPRKVEEILVTVANDHPKVLKDPAPRVWFHNFGDSSLDFVLLAWVYDPASTGLRGLRSELRFAITDAFTANGIEIPFPQRDLHIRSIDETAADRLAPRPQEG
ncbi:MAG: mechanosensitive ion channel [Nitrospirota bacterium]|jgi:small-conductance mechanosensitive channel